MQFVLAVLFVLTLLAGWAFTLLSLPGIWLMVAAAALYAWLTASDSVLGIGWPVVVAMLALALSAELLESAAGAVAVSRLGGSRRGMVLAMIGSIVGGVVGAAVGLPVPVVGTLIGVIVVAAVGALIGALLGESWKGRDLATSWNIGRAAFWGRMAGSLAKIAIATTMLVIVLVAMIF